MISRSILAAILGVVSYGATLFSATIPVTDSRVLSGLSPYNWVCRDESLSSTVNGASLKLWFKGTRQVTLQVATDHMATHVAKRFPIIAWSVNGGTLHTHQLAPKEASILQAIYKAALPALDAIVTTAVRALELPIKDGQKIAFMGDSITEGGANDPAGYVNLVIRGLEANGIRATAIPAGMSGHRATQMLRRLDRDVLSKKPEWMTLSCGVNDVGFRDKGVPLDLYKESITKIIDQCQAAGVKVMILNLPRGI